MVAEAGHLLENHPKALDALRRFLARIEIAPMLHNDLDAVFSLMQRFAPNMDVADACLVSLSERHEGAIILTTDTRDFSTYRRPFASPEGLFAGF